MMKVSNMKSPNGTKVANHFIIHDAQIDTGEGYMSGTMFQSYESNIAFVPYDGDVIYLGENWDYSRTTSKYRNIFLGIDTIQLKARVADGRAVILEEM